MKPTNETTPAPAPVTLAQLCDAMELTVAPLAPRRIERTDDWWHVHFRLVLSKGGREVWQGDFRSGLACLGKLPPRHKLYNAIAWHPYATLPDTPESRAFYSRWLEIAKPRVEPAALVSSLLMDGAAHFDSLPFTEWCSDFGYSDDSIKARAAWQACIETGMKLARAFTAPELAKLRELASDY